MAARNEFRPLVTYDTFRSASIDSYYEDFAAIYQRDTRQRAVPDLWLHVVDHTSRLVAAARRQNLSDMTGHLADSFVWLMGVIAQCRDSQNPRDHSFRFSQSPSDIIWNKYPATCPACFDAWLLSLLRLTPEEASPHKIQQRHADLEAAIRERAERYTGPIPCTCLARCDLPGEQALRTSLRSELAQYRLAYAARLREQGKKITDTDALEAMFQAVYAGAGRVFTPQTVAYRLQEEVGRATRALKDCYTYDDRREPYSARLHAVRLQRLRDEVAGIFAWMFGLTLRARSTYGRMALEYMRLTSQPVPSGDLAEGYHALADMIWATYGRTVSGANWAHLKCPGCASAPCECPRDLRGVEPAWGEAKPVESEGRGERNLVFFSYSHKDAVWLERLEIRLKPLVRNLTLSVWDDRKIQPGQLWREEIASALSRARVAVLLVSADFLASDFIVEEELPPLLQAASQGGTRIIWVPVGACLYREAELGEYQAVLDPAKPLEGLSEAERNAALVKVCEWIKRAVQE